MNKLYTKIIQDLDEQEIPIDHNGIVLMLLNILDVKLEEMDKRIEATHDRITAYAERCTHV